MNIRIISCMYNMYNLFMILTPVTSVLLISQIFFLHVYIGAAREMSEKYLFQSSEERTNISKKYDWQHLKRILCTFAEYETSYRFSCI